MPAKSAANAFFSGNTVGVTSELTMDYTMNGLTLTGSGTATGASTRPFARVARTAELTRSVGELTALKETLLSASREIIEEHERVEAMA